MTKIFTIVGAIVCLLSAAILIMMLVGISAAIIHSLSESIEAYKENDEEL